MATRIRGHGHSLMFRINAHSDVDQTLPLPAPECGGRLSKIGTRCPLGPIAPEMTRAGTGLIFWGRGEADEALPRMPARLR
jgi:hypothetical protein